MKFFVSEIFLGLDAETPFTHLLRWQLYVLNHFEICLETAAWRVTKFVVFCQIALIDLLVVKEIVPEGYFFLSGAEACRLKKHTSINGVCLWVKRRGIHQVSHQLGIVLGRVNSQDSLRRHPVIWLLLAIICWHLLDVILFEVGDEGAMMFFQNHTRDKVNGAKCLHQPGHVDFIQKALAHICVLLQTFCTPLEARLIPHTATADKGYDTCHKFITVTVAIGLALLDTIWNNTPCVSLGSNNLIICFTRRFSEDRGRKRRFKWKFTVALEAEKQRAPNDACKTTDETEYDIERLDRDLRLVLNAWLLPEDRYVAAIAHSCLRCFLDFVNIDYVA